MGFHCTQLVFRKLENLFLWYLQVCFPFDISRGYLENNINCTTKEKNIFLWRGVVNYETFKDKWKSLVIGSVVNSFASGFIFKGGLALYRVLYHRFKYLRQQCRRVVFCLGGEQLKKGNFFWRSLQQEVFFELLIDWHKKDYWGVETQNASVDWVCTSASTYYFYCL